MAINYPWSPQMYNLGGPNYTTNSYGQFQTNSIFWVTGEAGAKAHPIAPNSSVLLMDQESNRFYVKSADLLGISSIRTYEYNEIVNGVTPVAKPAETDKEEPEAKPKEDKTDYVSRKEFDELKKTIDEFMS